MRYDACLARILSRAPGCPDEVAIDGLRDAAVEWCRGTYMLLATQQVTSFGASLVFSPGAGLQVIDIVGLKLAGKDAQVLPRGSDAIEMADADSPVCTFDGWPDALNIVPAPAASLTASAGVVYCPTYESEEMPDVAWSRHKEALIDGALARVLADEGTPWFKPQLAGVMRARFDSEMQKHAALYGRNRQTNARRLRVKPA
jgi:hypothetical protein